MRRILGLDLQLLCWVLQFCHVFAFLGHNHGLQRRIALYARLPSNIPPPPPPPPPPKPVVDEGLFDTIFKEITAKMEALSTTDLKFELPDFGNPKLPMETIIQLQKQIGSLESNVVSEIERTALEFQASLIESFPRAEPILTKAQLMVAPIVSDSLTQLLVSALLTYLIVSKLLSFAVPSPPNQPYPLGRYDPVAARAYFDQRPWLVVTRGLEVLVKSLSFGISLAQDKIQ